MSNPTAISGHRRRRRHSSPLGRFWWAALLLLAAGAGSALLYLRPHASAAPLEGYVTDPEALSQEYARWQGKPLDNADVRTDFEQATARMLHRDYNGAAAQLEEVEKLAAVPVVYNNLGVLYAELNDRARAVNAFRQALARDISYAPVRANLRRLRGFISDSAEPVTREIEPNNSLQLANVISLDSPVQAEIEAGSGDVDTFRVTTPPIPRDTVSIEITNHSPKLSLGFRVYDSDLHLTDWGSAPQPAGESISQRLSPQPGATLYLQVWGASGTAGAYTLKVSPGRAYDAFEPDDDIFSAHPLTVGERAEANIMDARDTDFYSFLSPRSGTVTVEIQNRSTTLIPALSMFGPDKGSLGFGPDLRTRGASLKQTMTVETNQTYYVQVWSQGSSFGGYSIIVE